jgi:hypothetical protein
VRRWYCYVGCNAGWSSATTPRPRLKHRAWGTRKKGLADLKFGHCIARLKNLLILEGVTGLVSGLFCIRFESVDSKSGYGSKEEVGSYADCFVLDGSDGLDWGAGLGDGAGLVAALSSKTKDCSTTWGHSCS